MSRANEYLYQYRKYNKKIDIMYELLKDPRIMNKKKIKSGLARAVITRNRLWLKYLKIINLRKVI